MAYPNGTERGNEAGSVSSYTGALQAQGLVGQQASSKTQQPAIRERLQEANKRADGIVNNLQSLAETVAPLMLNLAGLSNGSKEPSVAPSLSSDMDDLCRTLARIEQQVSRLTAAISG